LELQTTVQIQTFPPKKPLTNPREWFYNMATTAWGRANYALFLTEKVTTRPLQNVP
jgi:hypothetical protein